MISARSAASAALAAGALLTLVACAPEPPTAASTPSFAPGVLQPTPQATSSSRTRVVTLGDSLMSGFGLQPEEAWPVLLGSHARLSLTNLACAGGGFVATSDCGVTYAGFVPAVSALQPQIILVESSSNDFWQDGDLIRADTAETIELLHEAVPDALVVGLSTIWNDEHDVPDDTAVTSDALRDAVASVGGTYIDVGQPLAGHPEWMQPDDVHPTVRGQLALEQKVMAALKKADVLP